MLTPKLRLPYLAMRAGMLGLALAASPLSAEDDGQGAEVETEDVGSPILIEASYSSDVLTTVSDGAASGTRYLSNLDIAMEADLERLAGWRGATLLASGLYNNGETFSDLTGDAQVISSLEAGDEAVRLYELWINQEIGDSASLKLGLYDLNSEFDVLDASGLFITNPHGIGTDISQTGEAGPSIFPVTSLAARLELEPLDGLKIRTAILDGVPGDPLRPRRTAIKLGNGDGALLIAEAEATTDSSKLLFGHWRYTAEFETFAGAQDGGNAGWYLRGETRIVSELFSDDQGLDGFFRFGIAKGRFNPFGAFLSGGLTYNGPFKGRDEDQAGLAFATAIVSDEFKETVRSRDQETVFELTYRAPVNNWLSLQPSFQYVVNPSASPVTPDAAAVLLRADISFSDLLRQGR